MSFTARFALALGAGLAAAVVVAPIAAVAVASMGWRYPFPRIFDRTVMATLLLAMVWSARELKLGPLLRDGFKHPVSEASTRLIRGLIVAFCALAILFVLALRASGSGTGDFSAVASRVPGYVLSAIVIAIIEEGFFRAFLFGGMKGDFGSRGAMIASAAFYAVAHLVRSPAHFYVTGYEPAAGLVTLAHSMDQLSHPATAIPTLIGLFLLGIVLAKAFILTGNVYFSMGLHCGFVIGAKLWPKIIVGRGAIPWWIAGAGPVPMIGGAAAWVIAIVIFVALRPLTGRGKMGWLIAWSVGKAWLKRRKTWWSR
jgi:membrane protease YdiL (CAAX protease family)